jgi:hypothetical protein
MAMVTPEPITHGVSPASSTTGPSTPAAQKYASAIFWGLVVLRLPVGPTSSGAFGLLKRQVN